MILNAFGKRRWTPAAEAVIGEAMLRHTQQVDKALADKGRLPPSPGKTASHVRQNEREAMERRKRWRRIVAFVTDAWQTSHQIWDEIEATDGIIRQTLPSTFGGLTNALKSCEREGWIERREGRRHRDSSLWRRAKQSSGCDDA